MTKNEVCVLFGNKESIENYIVSVNYLIVKTPFTDYTVCSYELSDYKNSKDFLKCLNRFQEFLFIPQQEFDLIYHDLCGKARTFMKNIDTIPIRRGD